MMEKVELTQEQADAIGLHNRSNDSGSDGLLNKHARNYKEGFVSESWGYPYEALNEVEISKLAKALYIGYEVEPEFEVGDWVTKRIPKVTGIVTNVYKNQDIDVNLVGYRVPQAQFSKHYRHATPEEIAEEKERRWWAEHGREVWELKKGDLLNLIGAMRTIHHVRGNEVYTNEVSTIYALDLMKNIGTARIICFAEDRKDLERDEE